MASVRSGTEVSCNKHLPAGMKKKKKERKNQHLLGAVSSIVGEKDLKWGQGVMKRQTYNLAIGESGGPLFSTAGRQNDSFQPALLLAEVT